MVRAVTRSSTWFGSMLNVAGSMSAKTGAAPTFEIASAVAMNVWAVVMTSSPGADATCPQRELEGRRPRGDPDGAGA